MVTKTSLCKQLHLELFTDLRYPFSPHQRASSSASLALRMHCQIFPIGGGWREESEGEGEAGARKTFATLERHHV